MLLTHVTQFCTLIIQVTRGIPIFTGEFVKTNWWTGVFLLWFDSGSRYQGTVWHLLKSHKLKSKAKWHRMMEWLLRTSWDTTSTLNYANRFLHLNEWFSHKQTNYFAMNSYFQIKPLMSQNYNSVALSKNTVFNFIYIYPPTLLILIMG